MIRSITKEIVGAAPSDTDADGAFGSPELPPAVVLDEDTSEDEPAAKLIQNRSLYNEQAKTDDQNYSN